MPNKRSPFNRLSPAQLLVVLAVLLILGMVQYLAQRPGLASPLPAANTPFQTQSPTNTLLGSIVHSPTQTPAVEPFPSDNLAEFDYFVLALSWSPDYCATNGNEDPQQCSLGRKLGFVLHGLWPQYNQGYPSDCSTEKMTAEVKKQFPGLYPSDALYDHEWVKHGTCTGLSTTAYLEFTKRLKAGVVIPDVYRSPESPFRSNPAKLKEAFTLANPGFSAASFAVNCSSNGRYLKELYVCFSRNARPFECSAEVQKSALKSCQSPDFLVRNIR